MNAPHTHSEFIFVHMTELQLGSRRQEEWTVSHSILVHSKVQAQPPAGSTTMLGVLSID